MKKRSKKRNKEIRKSFLAWAVGALTDLMVGIIILIISNLFD